MKKYKICIIGEPETTRNELTNKLSKFFDIKSFDIHNLINKDSLDLDDLNLIRFKILLASENNDSFIFNGFPIDESDCEHLGNVDLVVFLSLDDSKAKTINQDRRWCPTCFHTYHLKQKPPIKENICDRCGSEIIIMRNDLPRTIESRILDWYKLYSKVLEYYRLKNNLLETNEKDVEKLSSLIYKILTGKRKPRKYRENKRFDKVYQLTIP